MWIGLFHWSMRVCPANTGEFKMAESVAATLTFRTPLRRRANSLISRKLAVVNPSTVVCTIFEMRIDCFHNVTDVPSRLLHVDNSSVIESRTQMASPRYSALMAVQRAWDEN